MDHGAAHELIHWAAAVVLVVGGVVAIILAARARAETARPVAAGPSLARGTPSVDRSLGVILAGLSLGAAALHLAAAPSHYVELGDLGAGFLAAAALQTLWARSSVGGVTARAVVVGLAINATILGLWALSRTAGLPIGPAPFVPEPIGLPDGAATVFEALLIVGLCVRALGLDRRLSLRIPAARSIAAVAVVPVLGLVLLTASLASVAIVAGAEHGAPAGDGPHVTHDAGR